MRIFVNMCIHIFTKITPYVKMECGEMRERRYGTAEVCWCSVRKRTLNEGVVASFSLQGAGAMW